MPRVRNTFEEERRNTWAMVEKWRTKHNYRFEEVGKIWGVTKSTVSARKRNPENITIFEIRQMNLSDEEIVEMVRGK